MDSIVVIVKVATQYTIRKFTYFVVFIFLWILHKKSIMLVYKSLPHKIYMLCVSYWATVQMVYVPHARLNISMDFTGHFGFPST